MNDNNLTLDNLNCPQFVDFTNGEVFNINDGADLAFENHIMGEKEEELFRQKQLQDLIAKTPLHVKKKDEAVRLLKETSNQQQVMAAMVLATNKATKKSSGATPGSGKKVTKPATSLRRSVAVPTTTSTTTRRKKTPENKENNKENNKGTVKYDPSKYSNPSCSNNTSQPNSAKSNRTIVVEAHVVQKTIESKADETRIIETTTSTSVLEIEETLIQPTTNNDTTILIQPPQPQQQQHDPSERRRSKSCNVPLNRTLVVNTKPSDTTIGANANNRRSRRTMLEIKEEDRNTPNKKQDASKKRLQDGSKPRTPCFERLYNNNRHRSADRTLTQTTQNVPNTPLLNMYRGLKFVPKFGGSKHRMSPAPSVENLHHNAPGNLTQIKPVNKQPIKPAPGSKPPTPPTIKPAQLNQSKSRIPTTTSHHQLISNLTEKINNLKLVTSSSTTSLSSINAVKRPTRLNPPPAIKINVAPKTKPSHKPVIVDHNKTVVKTTAVATLTLPSAPHFRTEARALKRQQSATNINNNESKPVVAAPATGIKKTRSFLTRADLSSQSSLNATKPAATQKLRNFSFK